MLLRSSRLGRLAAASVVSISVGAAGLFPLEVRAEAEAISIASQPLGAALNDLAKQAGILIIAPTELVAGISAPEIRDATSYEDALHQLLKGTGLRVIRGANGSFVIASGAAASEPNVPTTSPDREPTATVLDAVLVTGSRIARPEVASAMPVRTVSTESMEDFALIDLSETLARDPAVSTGLGLTTTHAWDNGASFINLRNMGYGRSLTLLNGKRRVSGSGQSSSVDVSTIPVGMIERTEILTGGAAAVYGADAVSGAVNIITKKNIQSTTFSASVGLPEHGGAERSSFSFSSGLGFADGRGRFSAGGTFSDSKPLYTYERDFGKKRMGTAPNPANTGPDDGIVDNVTLDDMLVLYFGYDPHFVIGNQDYIYEASNDASRQAGYDVLFTPTPLSWGNGGDGRNLNDVTLLRGPLRQAALMGNVEFDFTPDVMAGLDWDYSENKFEGTNSYYRSDYRAASLNGAGGPRARLDNPFLPDSIRQLMVANNLTVLPINKAYRELGLLTEEHNRKTWSVSPHLEGRLGENLNWNVFYQYGKFNDNVYGANKPIASRMVAATDVTTDANGNPVCRSEAARAIGCIPFDIFSGTASDELKDWLLHTRHEYREQTQAIYGGGLDGKLISLPYGDARFALGAEYRKETLTTRDDPLGLNGEVSHAAVGGGPHPNLDASQSVSEVYAEVVTPLLSDVPFAYRLELEGAYRISDYDSFGNTDTWKFGGRWAPMRGLTFRGVVSSSVRAPNFAELYADRIFTQPSYNDPCETRYITRGALRAANCAALGITTPLPITTGRTIEAWSGGNPNLQPETSRSWTAGIILEPTSIPRLAVTADFWSIELDDAIATWGYATVLNLCVDLPSIDNPYCRSITRGADGNVISVDASQINAGMRTVRGLDMGINYSHALGNGRLSYNFVATWLDKYETQSIPDQSTSIVNALDTFSNPKWVGRLSLNYRLDRFSVGLDSRYRDKSKVSTTWSPEMYDRPYAKAVLYNDLNVGYAFEKTWTIGAGVNNLFDVEPPATAQTYLEGGIYDVVGRTFFLRTKAEF
ncbi:TonB-dependent receptor [Steroidobacter sp. S1-65]|uniref:TonB-dependent receptor n=1 Tax=Steroidobacter gossypii TaxID=2805490 RepID=A0ABS1WXQ4_9GAMM|nr:TonB-dependent receptor [Steroidobacter gossypii]MBM0105743.1 TonB-dependent receptor [Steroidobacter gossypii]